MGGGVAKGVRRKGIWGVRMGVLGARMSRGNPPPLWRGNLRVATREWGPGGGGGGRGANWANRAHRANPPPSDPALARQVTFQVTYGVRWGANPANRAVGGGVPGAP